MVALLVYPFSENGGREVPPLKDLERLLAYRDALRNWSVTGYVKFALTETAYRWVRTEVGVELRELARLMNEFVVNGGEIDEQPETRPEWADQYQYHYDLRFVVNATPIYVETRLNFCPPFKPDDPWILVVNVHAQ